jgi:hypothetical protein
VGVEGEAKILVMTCVQGKFIVSLLFNLEVGVHYLMDSKLMASNVVCFLLNLLSPILLLLLGLPHHLILAWKQ